MSVRFPGFARLPLAAGLLAVALLGIETHAQQRPATTPAAEAPADPFPGLKFRNIGPATMAGRVDDLAVLESNPAVFYVGTATGGLWKTVNNGTTWTVHFDDLDDVVSIGDIAINPNDANTVWVGSGENNNRQSGSWGNGIFKSTDGGETWKHMGLSTSKQIARIIVDPIDHDVVYVAALGSLWGAGGERGVYKTTDGGLTWTRVLSVNDDTGATELVMDPSNNKVLYAATYQRRRATWGFNGGGPGSAMWKSSDAGRTWTKLTNGVPSGPLGRIGMDVYRANPNILYARIEHEKESGTYRSDDAGRTVAQDVERQPAADVFQPGPDRSHQRSARLRPRRAAAHFRRWRQDVHRERRDALGPPRDVDQPEELEPHHRRQRRRDRHQLGQGCDVGRDLQHGSRAVLPHHLRHGVALQRVRRPAGQLHVVRAVGGAQPHRHCQRSVVPDPRRRRLRSADRSEELAHHLRRVAGRQHLPRRQGQQRTQVDPPAAGAWRSAAAVELEHAHPDVAARSGDDLCRRQQGLQVHRSRPVVDGDQPRSLRRHRPRRPDA